VLKVFLVCEYVGDPGSALCSFNVCVGVSGGWVCLLACVFARPWRLFDAVSGVSALFCFVCVCMHMYT